MAWEKNDTRPPFQWFTNTINITWDLGPGNYICSAKNKIGYHRALMRVVGSTSYKVADDVNNHASTLFGSGGGVLSLIVCLVVIYRKKRLVDNAF